MDLSPEQQDLVRAWAAQGDSISDIQTKLASECGVHLSYMDTRFLLLDLSVTLAERNAKKSEPAPAPAAPEPAPEPEPEGYGAVPPLPGEAEDDAGLPPEEELPPEPGAAPPADPATPSAVQVELARIQRPGFAISGSVTFSDGVKGEWGLDGYGRLALAVPDNKGYRPSAADQRAFAEKLRGLLEAGY